MCGWGLMSHRAREAPVNSWSSPLCLRRLRRGGKKNRSPGHSSLCDSGPGPPPPHEAWGLSWKHSEDLCRSGLRTVQADCGLPRLAHGHACSHSLHRPLPTLWRERSASCILCLALSTIASGLDVASWNPYTSPLPVDRHTFLEVWLALCHSTSLPCAFDPAYPNPVY